MIDCGGRRRAGPLHRWTAGAVLTFALLFPGLGGHVPFSGIGARLAQAGAPQGKDGDHPVRPSAEGGSEAIVLYGFSHNDNPQGLPSPENGKKAGGSGGSAGGDEHPAQPSREPPAFGSRAILDACWSGEELEADAPRLDRRGPTTVPESLRTAVDVRIAHPPLPQSLRNSIRRLRPVGNGKPVALTFDLCETAGGVSGYDAGIVSWLRANRVRATFFAGGKWMQTHPEQTLQLMADPLFEIGNHSWTHLNFRKLGQSRMEEQVLRTQDQYRLLRGLLESRECARRAGARAMDDIPREPVLFRFPYGTCNAEALGFLASLGLAAIQWDVVTGDASPSQTASGIARIVLSRVKPGSIIICHANRRGHGTAAALPLFVPRLREMGYDFVTVSELLASGTAETAPDCYEERPGDNRKYDRITGVGKHADH